MHMKRAPTCMYGLVIVMVKRIHPLTSFQVPTHYCKFTDVDYQWNIFSNVSCKYCYGGGGNSVNYFRG